ncbi:MAG: hypothetical protein J3R72DRAFT_445408, partial [Linnemannia gamsii]
MYVSLFVPYWHRFVYGFIRLWFGSNVYCQISMANEHGQGLVPYRCVLATIGSIAWLVEVLFNPASLSLSLVCLLALATTTDPVSRPFLLFFSFLPSPLLPHEAANSLLTLLLIFLIFHLIML